MWLNYELENQVSVAIEDIMKNTLKEVLKNDKLDTLNLNDDLSDDDADSDVLDEDEGEEEYEHEEEGMEPMEVDEVETKEQAEQGNSEKNKGDD